MANHELREWLGVKPADLLAYVGIAAVVAMFYVTDATMDMGLAALGVVLAIAACPIGMKANPQLSKFTNAVKLVSYPLVVLGLLVAIGFHYNLHNLYAG
jgi:hypothetical protein